MKSTIEETISSAISKLDASFLLMILPCLLAIYICVYVDDKVINKWLGNPVEDEKIEIICPHCGQSFVYTLHEEDPERSEN